MEHKVVNLEPMRIAGYNHQLTMEQINTNNPIPGFWADLGDEKFGKLMSIGSDCPGTYGVSLMHNENDMDYTIGVALPKVADAPEGFHIINVPAGEYLEIQVSLANLMDAYSFAGKWMNENNSAWATHSTSFEFYNNDFSQTQSLRLYIPIMKK